MSEQSDLATQVAVLEERMNTHQADYRAALADLKTDMAKRETRMLLSTAAMLALALTIFGLISS